MQFNTNLPAGRQGAQRKMSIQRPQRIYFWCSLPTGRQVCIELCVLCVDMYFFKFKELLRS